MSTKIKIRRDTLNNWNAYNPTLDDGEIALVKDNKSLVLGDGTNNFQNSEKLLTYKLLKHDLLNNVTASSPYYIPDETQHIMIKARFHDPDSSTYNSIKNVFIRVNDINFNGGCIMSENIRGYAIDYRNDLYNLNDMMPVRFETDFSGTIDIPLIYDDNKLWDINTYGMRHNMGNWNGIYQTHTWTGYGVKPEKLQFFSSDNISMYIKIFILT